jgi:hypothetical protein
MSFDTLRNSRPNDFTLLRMININSYFKHATPVLNNCLAIQNTFVFDYSNEQGTIFTIKKLIIEGKPFRSSFC